MFASIRKGRRWRMASLATMTPSYQNTVDFALSYRLHSNSLAFIRDTQVYIDSVLSHSYEHSKLMLGFNIFMTCARLYGFRKPYRTTTQKSEQLTLLVQAIGNSHATLQSSIIRAAPVWKLIYRLHGERGKSCD